MVFHEKLDRIRLKPIAPRALRLLHEHGRRAKRAMIQERKTRLQPPMAREFRRHAGE
jgi:hypothetical protein